MSLASASFNTSPTSRKSEAKEPIRLSLSISPELNDLLNELAEHNGASKSEILRRAIALYDVAAEAKSHKQRIGIFDREKKLLTEIVGL